MNRTPSSIRSVANDAESRVLDVLMKGTPIERECVTRRLADGAVISRTTFRGRAATMAALLEVFEDLISAQSKPVCKIIFDCAHDQVHLHVDQSLPRVKMRPAA